jgi:outer membrane protein assembly factor BamB
MTKIHSRRGYLSALGAVGLTGLSGCAILKTVQRALASPGDEKWVFTTETDETLFPAVADETVYAGSTAGTLYAVESGSLRWEFETNGPIQSSPVVVAKTVIVGDTEGTLYAVDVATGEERWTFSTAGPVMSSPVAIGGGVYAGANKLYAVDTAEGTEQWVFSGDNSIQSPAALRETNTVYAGSTKGQVYAIDAADGSEKWTYETDGSVSLAPTVQPEEGVVSATDSMVFAINSRTGERNWQHAMTVADQYPMYMDGYVYAAGKENSLYNIGTDKGEWPYKMDATISSQIAGMVQYGAVYVGDEDGRFSSVNFIEGTKRWSVDTGGVVRSAPAVGTGTVYPGTDTGQLYALVEKNT